MSERDSVAIAQSDSQDSLDAWITDITTFPIAASVDASCETTQSSICANDTTDQSRAVQVDTNDDNAERPHKHYKAEPKCDDTAAATSSFYDDEPCCYIDTPHNLPDWLRPFRDTCTAERLNDLVNARQCTW